ISHRVSPPIASCITFQAWKYSRFSSEERYRSRSLACGWPSFSASLGKIANIDDPDILPDKAGKAGFKAITDQHGEYRTNCRKEAKLALDERPVGVIRTQTSLSDFFALRRTSVG